MRLQICVLRDRAVDAFGVPQFVIAVGQAIRALQDEVNREGSDIGKHPDDYELFHVGVYDDAQAQFETIAPKSIALARSLVVPK